MENKSMPTITEHFIQFYKENEEHPSIADIKEFTTDPYFIATMKSLHEYAVLFAKYHREKAIEATVNNFYTNYIGLKSKAHIKQDLENAYSEDNIK